jgi:hypothetical protein
MTSKKPETSLSDEVNRLYSENPNYLIEYSDTASNSTPYCIIYFSSNNIYYPDSKETFLQKLVEKNKFEWYCTRINCGSKHIFIRDIKKVHYLLGINCFLDTSEKVVDFLKKETNGYRVITVGSSSGGYAAVFFGQRLGADRIYCFNGQFLLDAGYQRFSEIEKSTVLKYSSLTYFFENPSSIFYFHSNKSGQDIKQLRIIEKTGVKIISFNSSVHGIPFLKCCLPVVLNLSTRDLQSLSAGCYDPWIFSLKMVGIWGTLLGSFKELEVLLRDRALIRTLKGALAL